MATLVRRRGACRRRSCTDALQRVQAQDRLVRGQTLKESEPCERMNPLYPHSRLQRVAGRNGNTRGRVADLSASGNTERPRETNFRSGDAKPIEHYRSFRSTL